MEPDLTFPYLCRRNGFRRYADVSMQVGKENMEHSETKHNANLTDKKEDND